MKNLLFIALIGLQSICLGQQQSSNELTVGDLAPIIAPFKWIKGSPIKNFEKGKIYVVEFGATWCSPCAAAIPELSELADQYKSEVEVLSVFVMENNREPVTTVNPLYVQKVERYVKKRAAEISYHVAVDGPDKKIEQDWLATGNRIGVPHVFVIDKSGKIVWIGNSVKAVPAVIAKIKSSEYSLEKTVADRKAAEKAIVEFNDKQLLLIDGNGGDSYDFLFRSILTRYDGTIRNPYPGNIDSFHWLDDPEFANYKDRLQVVGLPINKLYYLAYADTLSVDPRYRNSITYEFPDTIKMPHMKTSYGKYWHEPLLEVSDPAPFQWDRKSPWNRYNYSLKVPTGVGTAKVLQDFLRKDMEGYFGYNVSVESREMPYWKVVAMNKPQVLEKLKSPQQGRKFDIQAEESISSIKNGDMRDIIWFFASNFGYAPNDRGRLPKNEQAAFIDETGIVENIDFTIDRSWSFQQAQEFLRSNGLDVVKSHKKMKVVVISD